MPKDRAAACGNWRKLGDVAQDLVANLKKGPTPMTKKKVRRRAREVAKVQAAK
jgi:hypothetical protein